MSEMVERVAELEALVVDLRMKLSLANERPSDTDFHNLKLIVEDDRFSAEAVGMAIRWRWGQISPILFPEAGGEIYSPDMTLGRG